MGDLREWPGAKWPLPPARCSIFFSPFKLLWKVEGTKYQRLVVNDRLNVLLPGRHGCIWPGIRSKRAWRVDYQEFERFPRLIGQTGTRCSSFQSDVRKACWPPSFDVTPPPSCSRLLLLPPTDLTQKLPSSTNLSASANVDLNQTFSKRKKKASFNDGI